MRAAQRELRLNTKLIDEARSAIDTSEERAIGLQSEARAVGILQLSAIAEEYRTDNLPITFRGRLPDGQIDVANDPRLFVEQLRLLDLSAIRIRNAIVDYYRAFEQRSSWARESLLISDEIEEYEDRLVDEWTRYREIVFPLGLSARKAGSWFSFAMMSIRCGS
ncbi:ABC-three component system protein [Bradyrhizobium brasilense]|uniref:ABC-three component system protein n=1 Tax=Bradyrhizobium brasilense TaxID=1419277 RepID=UPI001F233251|nr:ABC-three component system protein [Bradyrhizobium brasilense]